MTKLFDHLSSGTVLYTTEVGAQLCGESQSLLAELPPESVDLFITSPPFPLLRKKAYGNEDQKEYVAWLTAFAKLAHTALKPTGSLVIDIGGAYQRGRPVRSLHQFRALIAFIDELGYFLAEEFYWFNPARLPSPIEWVNKRKIRAKDAVNTVWWLSKTDLPKADISKVRIPYSDSMQRLLRNPEGYYRPKDRPSEHVIGSAFGLDNGGALPPNLLVIPNTESNSFYLRMCQYLDTPSHPARFPSALPEFFIRMLTEPGDVVVDFFSGSNTTGKAAEDLNRRWLAFEKDRKYAALSALRFLEDQPPETVKKHYESILAGQKMELSAAKPPQSSGDAEARRTDEPSALF
ncbi:DNA-methyltransferase [Streptosporangium jomthongense]|uniref:Methyltransferase n=1 Tax=Streptosporangium jomthongense TaxID=1193683 RepID=A0ABV8F4G8_9ACTN